MQLFNNVWLVTQQLQQQCIQSDSITKNAINHTQWVLIASLYKTRLLKYWNATKKK